MNGLIKKAGLGFALAATAVTAAAPAEAQRYGGYGGYRHYGHRGGDTTGAAILGGIVGLGVGAAIASSNRDRYYDRGRYDRGYYGGGYRQGYYGDPRGGYYDDRYNYGPRCWIERRFDPYYGTPVRVRVCD